MKILVVGDSCKDVFSYGRADRMCPEAPVPVFVPAESVAFGGMIHNVAYHLNQMGVEFDLKHSETESTKTRFIDKKTNQMIMRLDVNGACTTPFNRDFLEDIRYDAVIISDYGTGYLSQYDIQYLIRQSEYSFVDTKQKLGTWLAWATFVKINQVEWEMSRTPELESALHHNLIVTTGPGGCQYKDCTYEPQHVETVVDTSGAGDVFLAGLAAKYLESQDVNEAIQYANDAASQVVKVRGVRTKLNLPGVNIE